VDQTGNLPAAAVHGQVGTLGNSPRRARGITLVELLIAAAVMSMIAAALAALAVAVRTSADQARNHGSVTQHAHIILGRLQQTLERAHASESFPGFLAVTHSVQSWEFPDALVVWRASGGPADANGLPRFQELVFFVPDPQAPNRLLEVTLPGDTRPVPPPSDQAAWRHELAQVLSDPQAQRLVWTDRLRVASAGAASGPWGPYRGAVRFEVLVRPTETEWSRFRAGQLAWQDIAWVQNIRGAGTGLRQACCQIELQLVASSTPSPAPTSADQALTFFASAALYYELRP
jgi:type II secretory pathway pseudopilin PulG